MGYKVTDKGIKQVDEDVAEGLAGTAIDVSEEVQPEVAETPPSEAQAETEVRADDGGTGIAPGTEAERPKEVDPSIFTTKEKAEATAPTAAGGAPGAPGSSEADIDVPDPMATMTARQMSELFVSAYATYIPKWLGDYCKVSIPSVMLRQQMGVLPPFATSYFTTINNSNERDLQVDAQEQEFLVKGIMPLVKIRKINEKPEIAALMALGMSLGNKIKQMAGYKKANEELMAMMMKTYMDEMEKRKAGEKIKETEKK